MRYLFIFSGLLFTLIFSGCGQSKLEKENILLKTELDATTKRADKAETDFKSANSEIEAQKTNIANLKESVDEKQKTNESLTSDLKQANSEIVATKTNLEDLKNTISDIKKSNDEYQKTKEKLEKSLEIYRDKSTAAINKIKALRSTLNEDSVDASDYTRNYLNTKMAVEELLSEIPEKSEARVKVSRALVGFSFINAAFVNTDKSIDDIKYKINTAYRRELSYSNYGDYMRERYQKMLDDAESTLITARNKAIKTMLESADKMIKEAETLIVNA